MGGLGAGEGLKTPDPTENFRILKKFQDVERCFSKSICDLRVSSCLVRYDMPVFGGFNSVTVKQRITTINVTLCGKCKKTNRHTMSASVH